MEGTHFVFINIYAPNKENEKKTFFKDLLNVIQALDISPNDHIIAGGDWNTIFNLSLDKSGGTNYGNTVITEMQEIIDVLDLCDIRRTRNVGVKRYTYRQKTPLIQSRLDYFLISNPCLDMVCKVDVITSVWSDHSGISLNMNYLPETTRGKGFWKFNNSFLENEQFVK